MLSSPEIVPLTLPNGKVLSRIGFGCSSFWARPGFPLAEAQEVLASAVRDGVTYFDTGPSYALGEERLAAFLASRDSSNLVISTKVGTDRDARRSFAPDRMGRSLDASLARLGLDRVDILYLHGPEIRDLESGLDFALAERRSGRAELAGINSFDPVVVERAVHLPFDVVMLQYNVVDQQFAPLIEALVQSGKIVVAGTALAQGIFNLRSFAPTSRRALWYLMRALYRDPLFAWKGARLHQRLIMLDGDPYAAALRFVTSHPLIASSVFNSTKVAHVQANIAAAKRVLSEQDRATLITRSART